MFNFELYLRMMHELAEATRAVRASPNTENMARFVQLVHRSESAGLFVSKENRDFCNDVQINLKLRKQAEQQF